MYKDVNLKDYSKVTDLILKENLSIKDIDEGLEPFEVDVKIAYTKHAIERMFNTENREADFFIVEELFKEKSNKIFEIKNGEEFILMNSSKTLAIVCNLIQQEGYIVITVITVIRKIFIAEERVVERKVFVDYKKNNVL